MTKIPSEQTETAWVLLIRTQQLLLDKVETMLKQSELPPLSWYDVLLELSRDPPTGLRQFEIGERVLLNKHNLSRLIDRLEREKLVERKICDDDGRGNVVVITKKGLRLKANMWKIYSKGIQELIGDPLNTSQIHSLTSIMQTLLKKNTKLQEIDLI